MVSSACSLAAAFILASGDIPHPGGYLLVKPDGVRTAEIATVIPYEPREGDLIFYDDHSKVWTALFKAAGTGPPLHMGIVVEDQVAFTWLVGDDRRDLRRAHAVRFYQQVAGRMRNVA